MDDKKLISLVEQNPIVFNVSHEHFSNGNYKRKAWNKIAEQLGSTITGEICKKTWTKIRNRYLRVRAHRKSTNRQPHQIMNKWQHEDEMDFYAKYLTKRREFKAGQPDSPLAGNFKQLKGANSLKNQSEQSTADQPVNRNEDQSISVDDETEDFVKCFDESSEDEDERMPPEGDDVLKTFFDAMLETVTGFSDRSQHNAKAKIFSIVSELEQRELDLKALMKA